MLGTVMTIESLRFFYLFADLSLFFSYLVVFLVIWALPFLILWFYSLCILFSTPMLAVDFSL